MFVRALTFVSTEYGRSYAFPPAGNDDTIKFSAHISTPARPPRPPRPNRPLPPKPSLASLTDSAIDPSGDSTTDRLSQHARSPVPSRSASDAASHRYYRGYDANPHAPAMTSTSSAGSPLIDLSSTSSSSSSAFFNSNLDSYDSSSSFPALGRSHSHTTAYYDQNRRRAQASVDNVVRSSTYTTNTSVSDWEREREEEMRNSRSGIFDLENELEQKFAYSGADTIHSTHSPTNLLSLPPRALAPSPSPSSKGFGLGITSDDAIHPDNPSQPTPALASPAVLSAADEYFGSDLSASGAVPAPAGSTQTRWETTRPYLRRNTASSVSRSVSRMTSSQSLRRQGAQQVSGSTSQEAWDVLAREQSDSLDSQTMQISRQPSYRGQKQARRRSPSFSAFSTSSNGIAALATLSYAEANSSGGRIPHSRSASVSTTSTDTEDLERDLEELDLDVQSRPVREVARPQSQAVALVENGHSTIVRLGPDQSLDDLATVRSKTVSHPKPTAR